VQRGQDPQDALSCRSLSAKQPSIIGLFNGKNLINLKQNLFLQWFSVVNRVVNKSSSNLTFENLHLTKQGYRACALLCILRYRFSKVISTVISYSKSNNNFFPVVN